MIEARTAPTPKDTVFREGRGSVYRFRRPEGETTPSARGSHVPLLLVPSMINRWYVFDLCEGASLVSHVARGPWETYCFDWGVPEDEDRYQTWDDVVARLARVVRFVQRTTGSPKVALLGYSIGSTLSGIHAALEPDSVAALVNLVGPFDFAKAGALSAMVDPRWFDPEAMTAAGNFASTYMLGGFHALAPTMAISKWVALADRFHEPGVHEAFAALESWTFDTVPFPGAAYVTYIKELYQQNLLLRGEHFVAGRRADLSRITCPLLSIVAEKDKVCPPGAVTALNDATRSTSKEILSVPGGHVSSVIGGAAATMLYPKLVAWLGQHLRRTTPAALPAARFPESRL